MSTLRLGLLQVHPVVGDVAGNRDRLASALAAAAEAGVELAVTGELVLCGYPPQSLVVDEGLLAGVARALEELAEAVPPGMVAVVGAPHATHDRRGVHNAAAVLTPGHVAGWADKQHLPTYALFDEGRYFVPARHASVLDLPAARVGVTICADLWEPEPSAACAAAGVDLIVALNASPYSPGMQRRREATTIARALEHTVPLAYVNLVGGQDGLVFDGGSHVTDHTGRLVSRGPALAEAVVVCDVDLAWARRSARAEPHRRAAERPTPGPVRILPLQPGADPDPAPATGTAPGTAPPGPAWGQLEPWPDSETVRWTAASVALRDVAAGLGATRVLVGLDGTLGAGLTAVLARDALGPDAVELADVLPETTDDDDDRRAWQGEVERACGRRAVPAPVVHVTGVDGRGRPDDEPGLVVPGPDPEERLVASRASRLALELEATRRDALLVSTADRTMRALGGGWPHETAGGFAPFGDLTRTWIVRLALWLADRDENPVAAPPEVVDRAGAVLGGPRRLDQPCALLDRVVEGYIDAGHPPRAIADREGLDVALVAELCDRIDAAEGDRRQMPLAPRMSGRALSDDRRMPVVWRRGWAD